ncbi:MAG: hypothetical protein M1510_12410 [Nitrospirae bacterium]|nr:hypothetical protein [Nitrospirota bacterium]
MRYVISAALEGVTVVALRDKENDDYAFNPSRQTVLTGDKVIIIMGNIDIINGLKDKANPPALP